MRETRKTYSPTRGICHSWCILCREHPVVCVFWCTATEHWWSPASSACGCLTYAQVCTKNDKIRNILSRNAMCAPTYCSHRKCVHQPIALIRNVCTDLLLSSEMCAPTYCSHQKCVHQPIVLIRNVCTNVLLSYFGGEIFLKYIIELSQFFCTLNTQDNKKNQLTRAFADGCQLHQLRRPSDVVWDAVRDGDDEVPPLPPPRLVCLHFLLDDVVPYRW